MNRRKRPLRLFVLGILSLVGLVYLIINYSPNSQITLPLGILAKWGILNFQFSILYIFFLLFFIFLLSFISYFLRSPRRAVLIGLLTVAYLGLRIFRIDSLYLLLLIITLYICLELFFKKDQ
jgi:hypothetical protein